MDLSLGKMHGGRPTVYGRNGVVASGHYLASEIGVHILRRGGNAFDAAVAAIIVLQLTKPHQNGFAGENPTLLYCARQKKAHALSGHGPAPAAATLERVSSLCNGLIPGDGFLPAVVPSAFVTCMYLLKTFGTLSVETVLTPALTLAVDGFAMAGDLSRTINAVSQRFRTQWPSSAALFLPDGEVPATGALFCNPDFGHTLERLIEAAAGKDRETGCTAAADRFYRGDIAREIVDFIGDDPCALLTLADFAAFQPALETPASITWRGMDVVKCPTWTQGPVLLQSLNLLQSFDLEAMGHNTGQYIHTVVEAMKLAYADREFYYGDPDFSDIPLERLLDPAHAAERAGLITDSASLELRPDGYAPLSEFGSVNDVNETVAAGPQHGDTTKLDIIDGDGNAISITTSGGWLQSSPVIPGLGFPLGTRGQMFSLQPGHPNCIAPGKRPRTTLTPGLALKGGEPYLAFGSPGGDGQDQWALQFLFNTELFGMDLQEAIEAPTFWSRHWPDSFYPRNCEPGKLLLESRIETTAIEALAARGHHTVRTGAYAGGNTCACRREKTTRGVLLSAGASPRLEPAYALAY